MELLTIEQSAMRKGRLLEDSCRNCVIIRDLLLKNNQEGPYGIATRVIEKIEILPLRRSQTICGSNDSLILSPSRLSFTK